MKKGGNDCLPQILAQVIVVSGDGASVRVLWML